MYFKWLVQQYSERPVDSVLGGGVVKISRGNKRLRVRTLVRQVARCASIHIFVYDPFTKRKVPCWVEEEHLK